MSRKRAPGGGRKPKGEIRGKSAVFSTRIRPETRKKLDAAAKAKNISLSQEVERRLVDSFGIGREQNKYLAALFYLMSKSAEALGPNWEADAWKRQAFKAAAIAALNRRIATEPCEVPKEIKNGLPDVTFEQYGKMLEWCVDLFVQMTPEGISGANFPSGSFIYAIPQARRALGIPFDQETSRDLLNKLGEPPSSFPPSGLNDGDKK